MNTSDLANLMHMTPDFYGVVPCCEIEQFKKHDVVGLIVNTDPHDKPGQHWIGLYKNGASLNFFDSFGREMQEFTEPFASIMKDFSSGLKVRSNHMHYQNAFTDTCGLWTLYYILSRICEIEVFNDFTNDTVKNEVELEKRLNMLFEKLKKFNDL